MARTQEDTNLFVRHPLVWLVRKPRAQAGSITWWHRVTKLLRIGWVKWNLSGGPYSDTCQWDLTVESFTITSTFLNLKFLNAPNGFLHFRLLKSEMLVKCTMSEQRAAGVFEKPQRELDGWRDTQRKSLPGFPAGGRSTAKQRREIFKKMWSNCWLQHSEWNEQKKCCRFWYKSTVLNKVTVSPSKMCLKNKKTKHVYYEK